MLKFLAKLSVAVLVLVLSASLQASTPGPLIKIPYPPPTIIDDDDEGERMPGRPIYWSVNFDSCELEIYGYDIAQIQTFEILNEERNMCLFTTDECAEFVAELASTNAPVYVIFYFDGFTLSGYFGR